MLKYFFEKPINGQNNKHLFDGMKIMEAGERYTNEQEQYPMITLMLKSAKQPNWNLAFRCLKDEIVQEFRRHSELLTSDKSQEELPLFRKIYYDRAEFDDYVTAFNLHIYIFKSIE